MRRLLSAVVALCITAICLWALLTPDILKALGRAAGQARPLPILVAFALVALVQWLRAWRFAVMTAGTATLPDMALVRIALQLNCLNFVLPFRLGELSYPVLMRHRYGHGLLHSAGVLWNQLHGETEQPRFRVRMASVSGKSVTSLCGLGLTPQHRIQDIRHTDLVLVSASGDIG